MDSKYQGPLICASYTLWMCILQCTSKGYTMHYPVFRLLFALEVYFPSPASLVSSFVSFRLLGFLLWKRGRSRTHLLSIIHAGGKSQASCSFSLVNGRGLVSCLSGHTRSASYWPDLWLTKPQPYPYCVCLSRACSCPNHNSNRTMGKRGVALTGHASSQPHRDLSALLASQLGGNSSCIWRCRVNRQCAFSRWCLVNC